MRETDKRGKHLELLCNMDMFNIWRNFCSLIVLNYA